MNVDRPIFIVGAGRSGSTIFHKTLCQHEELAWLSPLCDKYPDKPAMNRGLMRALGVPVLGPLLMRRYHPSECYTFWDTHFRGFSTPHRDLVAGDVTKKVRKVLPRVMSGFLTDGRPRLLVKITGWPRIGFLQEIFPDAKFIHIVRDGRAVANSLLNVEWWNGWNGPANWAWGELRGPLKERWQQHNESFVALAGIAWEILMEAMERSLEPLDPDVFVEIKYEDMCEDPVATFKAVSEFCEIGWPAAFEKAVRNTRIRNTNDKWRAELTEDQAKSLESLLADRLKRWGYL